MHSRLTPRLALAITFVQRRDNFRRNQHSLSAHSVLLCIAMTVEPSNSTLQTLVEIAVSSVSTLESIYQAHGASFPSLDVPYISHGLDNDEQAKHAATLIMSAAH